MSACAFIVILSAAMDPYGLEKRLDVGEIRVNAFEALRR